MKATKPSAVKLVREVMNEMRAEYKAFNRLAVQAEAAVSDAALRAALRGKTWAYGDAYMRLRRLLRQLEGK